MAKKKKKKTPTPAKVVAAAAAIAGAPTSPCDRGKDILKPIRVQSTQHVQAFFKVCASPATLFLYLRNADPAIPAGEDTIFHGRLVDVAGNSIDEITCNVTTRSGRFDVVWEFVVVDNWEVCCELYVDGVLHFRKTNKASDNLAIPMIYCGLEVI
jgi:hypothetical protein